MPISNSPRQIIVAHANTIHDPAICVIEGEEVFAESFERHMQCKRGWEANLYYSARPLTNALKHRGIWPIVDAEIKVLSTWDTKDHELWEKPEVIPIAPIRAQAEGVKGEWRFNHLLKSIFTDSYSSLGATIRPRHDIRFSTSTMAHHLSHAANCALTSPFDECVIMILDGFAEESCSAFYYFEDNRLVPIQSHIHTSIEKEVVNHSFGTAYAVATTLCGFNPTAGEEWKVMGLAAYGEHRPDLQEFFSERTSIDGLTVDFGWLEPSALLELNKLAGGFRESTDPDIMRSADLAHNFQRSWEEAVIGIIKNLDAMGLSKNLAYGGGCALNSSTNGKILNRTSFEHLHIPSAPGDDGNSLGAALYEKHCVSDKPRCPSVYSPYLGSTADLSSLEKILSFGGIAYRRADDDALLCDLVSDFLIGGAIVGWMQGQAEFGPRAQIGRAHV